MCSKNTASKRGKGRFFPFCTEEPIIAIQARPPIRMPSKASFCKYYKKGACTRGAECSFVHTEDELRALLAMMHSQRCASSSNTGACDNPSRSYAQSEEKLHKSNNEDRGTRVIATATGAALRAQLLSKRAQELSKQRREEMNFRQRRVTADISQSGSLELASAHHPCRTPKSPSSILQTYAEQTLPPDGSVDMVTKMADKLGCDTAGETASKLTFKVVCKNTFLHIELVHAAAKLRRVSSVPTYIA